MRTFDLFEVQLITDALVARDQERAMGRVAMANWFLTQPKPVREYLNKMAQVADCYVTAQYWLTGTHSIHWTDSKAKAYAMDWMRSCAGHLDELKTMTRPEYHLPCPPTQH